MIWKTIKSAAKKALPKTALKSLRPIGHGLAARNANRIFNFPSNKLVVIGVTGTNGKTTTINLIAEILRTSGYKTGHTSTVSLNLGQETVLNPYKMTMPSGWLLNSWLNKMVKNGCQFAVLEVSSEGLAQNRHLGINFDVAVFTNLTPEHLESHGGFENYKKAKAVLFQSLSKHSVTKEKLEILPNLQKTIIANLDDQYGEYFLNFKAQKHVSFGVKTADVNFQATDISYDPTGISYKLKAISYKLLLKGQFDVYNSLAAIAACESLGVSLETCKQALEKIPVIPGRVEVLQHTPFTVVVDYAYEPEEMKQLYETITRWKPNGVLQVMGATGGGRDHDRIETLGKMAGAFAKEIFITTDDPYDDDPKTLGQQMLEGAITAGKKLNQNIFFELDRRKAIQQAIKNAKPGDIVLITGKGADQKMALANGKYIDWDDRQIAKEFLIK